METPSASWNPAELTTHHEWVRGLALQLVRDSARADDLVQETFLAALERKPEQGRSLRPWLRRVLHNRFAFGRRSEARRLAREEEGASPEGLPSSDELVQNAEAHALLVSELTRLREPYRTALLLRFFEGKSPAEIAASQGVPAATVRSHLKRGLDELRERLDRRNGGKRRAWSLALIPLAAASRDAIPPGGVLSPLTQSIRAMNPLTQIVVGSTVLLATAAFVAQQVELLPPGGGEIGALDTPGGGTSPPAALSGGANLSTGTRTEAGSRPTSTASGSEDQPITGVVVDAESGTPLTDYAVEFRLVTFDAEGEPVMAEEDREEVRTDEAGNFATERVYAAGAELSVSRIDHRGMSRVIRSNRQTFVSTGSGSSQLIWDPEEAPLQLSAGIGPMYALALTAPFDWRSVGLIAYLEPVEDEPWSLLETCSLMYAPVRGESGPWVRFDRVRSFLPADRPWRLRLETPDGLFGGEAQVNAGEGIYPEPVPIVIQPAAKLSVNLISESGLATSTVIAQAVNGGSRRVLLGGAQERRDDGLYRCCRVLHSMPPGQYDLLVTCEGVEPIHETVTLLAGEAFSHDIEIQHGPGLSFVRGELRSVSGQYQDPITLWLTHRVTGIGRYARPEWEERDGEWVAPLEFTGLIEGEYDLIFYSLGDYHRWDGLPATVTPPYEELNLTCHDTEPVRTLKIVMTDIETGELLPQAFAFVTLDGCAISQMAIGGGGKRIVPGVPTDRPLVWRAYADGYIPQWGDENDISGTEPFKDMVYHVIEVALEPGWGARIDVRELAGREPLEGVEVIVDDVLAGTTDETGVFELILEEKPLSVELRREGWRFARGSYDDDAHELTSSAPTHHVLFEPVP